MEQDKIEYAIYYATKAHKGQKRKQGTPYYMHPLEVSKILKEKGFSKEYQIVGLFHDLLEDTDAAYEEIERLTNKEIAEAVKLLTKEPGYCMKEYIERIEKNYMAKIVKLADRIHNLSEAHLASSDFQERYVKETEKWFIGLAKGTKFEEDLKEVLLQVKEQIKNRVWHYSE